MAAHVLDYSKKNIRQMTIWEPESHLPFNKAAGKSVVYSRGPATHHYHLVVTLFLLPAENSQAAPAHISSCTGATASSIDRGWQISDETLFQGPLVL